MEGRIYRLRRKSRINYFDPATYEAANKKIQEVFASNAIQMAEIKTADTTISPFIKEVLEFNGIPIENVTISSGRRIKYKIKERSDRDKAVGLMQKMKNDVVLTVDFSGSTPVGNTVNGLRVPLVGYTEEKANKGDKGVTTISGDGSSSADAEEQKNSINWYLVGAAVLLGAIIIIAVVKSMRKK